MARAVDFYFDFASPYAYFSLGPIDRLAREHGLTVEWHPILVWAVLKAHGIAPPMDPPAKRAYFMTDMVRSAAFHGVPYRHPARLPLSSHRAARLYYAIAAEDPETARAFGRSVFSAFFTQGLDISEETTLVAVAAIHGIGSATAKAGIEGETGRERLAEAVDQAVAAKVLGSPFFILDGEPFFGADRIPQLAWRLSRAQPPEATGA